MQSSGFRWHTDEINSDCMREGTIRRVPVYDYLLQSPCSEFRQMLHVLATQGNTRNKE